MKRLNVFVLAILLVVAGNAYADHIPTAVDAKNEPAVWTADVYNGSASTITSGYVVQWDFETSDSAALDGTWYDDMCPWVITADAVSDIWTAGVVPFGKDIAAYSPGAIIIRGPAYVKNYLTTPPTANQLAGSHTNGTVTADTGSGNTTSLGICIDATPEGGPGYDATSAFMVLIYVDPTSESD